MLLIDRYILCSPINLGGGCHHETLASMPPHRFKHVECSESVGAHHFLGMIERIGDRDQSAQMEDNFVTTHRPLNRCEVAEIAGDHAAVRRQKSAIIPAIVANEAGHLRA